MKRTLEEEMASALEGQFFWEPTTKYEDPRAGLTCEIRKAQRQFAVKPKKIKKDIPLPHEKAERVAERIAAQNRIPDEVRKIKDAILEFYGFSEADFEGGIPRKHLYPALAHYIWVCLERCLYISTAGLGRIIGKDHSTVIYHRNLFEKNKDKFIENIETVNRILDEK